MSRRAELYRVVRDLKNYLRWQQASGAVGSVEASAEAREAFEAKKVAREKAKLERLTRSLRDDGPDETVADQNGARPSRSGKTEQDTVPSSEQEPTQDDTSRFNPFGDNKKKTPEVPDLGKSSSSATPWKTGVGSRPTKRFGGRKEAEDKPASRGKQASQDKQAPQVKKKPANASANSGSNSEPPVDYDAYYPEAAGMVEADGYDPSREGMQASSPTSSAPTSSAPTPQKDPATMSKPEKLAFLQEYLGDCQRCGLCENRTNIVFGTGNPEAKLVFVGEAPGFNEDKQAEPFVGKAGQFLDKMIVAMGLKREDVYICNVIKCRPPDNRDPQADEIKECSPFLRKQLGVIEPTVIVTLGKFASQFLTGKDDTMGAMRGNWHEWEGIPVMPTYHPAYLLRGEGQKGTNQKGKTWNDLQMVMERLGLKGS